MARALLQVIDEALPLALVVLLLAGMLIGAR